ncbi:asparaginase [Methylibium petroleiphilum]|uniref:asparaginase n=1 Tax=Methylibium petroleiphilum TaxID=105560 RepID=UPI001AD38AC5|nr:asparaginase [Methylibium petroleiphilum]MBN9203836.1 asparaginase [Methylibium petroleiphilum]
MQSPDPQPVARVVILATGGTIAGTAATATDSLGYTAAQLGIAQLLAAVPALAGQPIEAEQVAQIDSKDMGMAVWRSLTRRVAHHLARTEVSGVVVTHGTDTLEETAYLLQRVLAPAKPVVLTGAMRPATAVQADGPQNLLDALALAREPGAAGVCAVFAGSVLGAFDVRKRHTHRLDAFGAGDDGAIALIEGGGVRRLRDWPASLPLGIEVLERPEPWVEIVVSHAGASGAVVEALRAQGVDGVVVAGTGNGSLHHALEAALRSAQAAGVMVQRCTRVADGAVLPTGHDALPISDARTPAQARIELMLALMARGA